MRTAEEAKQVNRFLGRAGFAQLDEPGALLAQLGFLIADHNRFRSLLTRCEPELRRNMYESLRPHLRFEPHTLDVYLAEAQSEAERKQLPTIAADGSLIPFRQPVIESDAYVIQQAIAADLAKHRLTLTCRKCTRQEVFTGERKADAVFAARAEGWTYDEVGGTGVEICPKCPGGGAN